MSASNSAVVEGAMKFVADLDYAALRAVMTDDDVEPKKPEDGDEVLDPEFVFRQSRAGEDTSKVAINAQMKAIYTSKWFWELAKVCPNNRLWWGGKTTDLDKRRPGAPMHFPDYLMLFLVCLAGIKGIATLNAAATHIRDAETWATLVAHMDQYVPEGWTLLSELPQRNPKKRYANPTLAVAKTPRNDHTRPLPRLRQSNVTALRPPITKPPKPNQLDYWVRRFRGVDLKNNPLDKTHEYYGLRDAIHDAFRRASIDQAQAMGVLRTDQQFVYGNPDRNQFIGFDGVVFAVRNHRTADTVDTHRTGTGHDATGSKFGLFSMRVDGQRHSRVIFDLAHIHKRLDGSHASEQDVIRELTVPLTALTDGGAKGLLVDSVARGELVTHLQRHGITVVNYPHAKSNPGRAEASAGQTAARRRPTCSASSPTRTTSRTTASTSSTQSAANSWRSSSPAPERTHSSPSPTSSTCNAATPPTAHGASTTRSTSPAPATTSNLSSACSTQTPPATTPSSTEASTCASTHPAQQPPSSSTAPATTPKRATPTSRPAPSTSPQTATDRRSDSSEPPSPVTPSPGRCIYKPTASTTSSTTPRSRPPPLR